jgi:hypothetical protein
LFLCTIFFASVSSAQYVGFGSVTNGAADCPGYETYHVTNLTDSGPGSFRDAVSAGCRLVVFDVAGEIELTEKLLIQHSYLTVDGSSAPSPGITIYMPRIRMAIEAWSSIGDAHDIIIHHLRLVGAGGDLEAADLLELDGMDAVVYNVVLDHITAVAASDGAFDIYGEVRDVTLSYNLIRDMVKPAHLSRNVQDRENITLHANVFARNNERQVRIRSYAITIAIWTSRITSSMAGASLKAAQQAWTSPPIPATRPASTLKTTSTTMCKAMAARTTRSNSTAALFRAISILPATISRQAKTTPSRPPAGPQYQRTLK